MTDLESRLAKLLGDGGVLAGEAARSRSAGVWRSEAIAAGLIMRPTTTEQISQALALCNDAAQPVVTHGGLTGLVQGADTAPGDVVLSMERMRHIENIDPVNRTMTVQAGAVLQDVQQGAEAAGLLFPLDLGARGSCTIGGNVATNAGGTQVIRYGMARDQVLGLEAVLADGTVLSSMNHMIKNNAGYDLKHLFMGTEGTLGVITRLVLRLREMPRSTQTAFLACDTLEQVSQLLKQVDAGFGGQLSSFEVLWGDYYAMVTRPDSPISPPLEDGFGFYVLVESQGSDADQDAERFEAVLSDAMEQGLVADAVIAASGLDRDALWAVRDAVEEVFDFGPVFTFDISLRISDMQETVTAIRQRLARDWGENHHCWVFGHLGDGNLHLVVAVGDDAPATRHRVEQAVYGPLAAVGGSVSAEHGIGLEKKPWLHLSRTPEELATMRRLKNALDPNGILNPGKVFD